MEQEISPVAALVQNLSDSTGGRVNRQRERLSESLGLGLPAKIQGSLGMMRSQISPGLAGHLPTTRVLMGGPVPTPVIAYHLADYYKTSLITLIMPSMGGVPGSQKNLTITFLEIKEIYCDQLNIAENIVFSYSGSINMIIEYYFM